MNGQLGNMTVDVAVDTRAFRVIARHLTACADELDDAAAVEPQLGLATTRELLEELKARGEAYSGEDPGSHLACEARILLADLPPVVLDYRTVDS